MLVVCLSVCVLRRVASIPCQAARQWVCGTLALKDFVHNLTTCLAMLGASEDLTPTSAREAAEALRILASPDDFTKNVLTLCGGASTFDKSFCP
jgi:hypothetical protein